MVNTLTRHIARSCLNFPSSYALLSQSLIKERIAAVFVHGYTGNSITTWHHFQTLVDDLSEQFPRWAEYDLYFYDYGSVYTGTGILADGLKRFLEQVFPKPQAHGLGLRPSDAQLISRDSVEQLLPERYLHIVLIGHSQGAVILRYALADIAALASYGDVRLEDASGVLRGDVRFFAPALFGFKPSHLPGFFYYFIQGLPLLRNFINPVLKSNPPHEELEYRSPFLSTLQSRTERFASRYPSMACMRAMTLFGDKEHVVAMERYDCDSPPEYVKDHDHVSLCKPTRDYLTPVKFVYGTAEPASPR